MIRFELPAGRRRRRAAARGARVDGDDVEFTTHRRRPRDLHTLTGWALDRGVELTGLSVTRPSLEDVFLGLAARRERASPMSTLPSPVPLLGRHVGYQVRTFARTPIAVFFTIVLPLIMLVLFNALFGGNDVDTGSGEWPLSQFYTGGLAAFTAVSATFTNLANVVPIRRDEGVLKRWRGTPLPPWVYIGGLIGSAIALAAAGVADHAQRSASSPTTSTSTRPRCRRRSSRSSSACSSFAAMGMAVAGLCPSASAASAVANAIILPMAFISDIFIPIEDPPRRGSTRSATCSR